jgi:selenocysteine-specific elongation factor
MNFNGIIEGGNILKITDEKFRTLKTGGNSAFLKALEEKDVSKFTELYFLRYSNRLVGAEEIASCSSFSVERIEVEIKSRVKSGKLIDLKGQGYLLVSSYENFSTNLMNVTNEILAGDSCKLTASPKEIRYRMAVTLDEALFETILNRLCTEGKLIKAGGGYQMRSLVRGQSHNKKKLIEKLTEFATKQGYATFSTGTFYKSHGNGIEWRDVQKALNYLHTQEKLVRLNDGRYLTSEAMKEIGERVRALIQRKGSLTIKDSLDILGYGRSRGVPVLDYLDSIGLTCRVGNVRVLKSENRVEPKQEYRLGHVSNRASSI